MPSRVVTKVAGPTAQNKTGTTARRKSLKPVSSTPSKLEPEAVIKADSKPEPTVEEKVVPFQDLNVLPVEAEPQKEMPLEDANNDDKESSKDADTPSAKGSEDGVKGNVLEKRETNAVMHEAQDNEDKIHDQDELTENSVVIVEHSHITGEASEGAECGEEPGDEGDDQRDVETRVMVKEKIKQKEFEVFVGGLHRDAEENDLKRVFSEIGEIVEIRLVKNPHTQKNRGFGFVRFATIQQAKQAVAKFKNLHVKGKQCGVTRNQDNETLYVRNICKSWTKEDLQNKLTEYEIENIEEITLTENPQQEGTNKGFAFLEFPTHLEATKALKRLQKRDVFFGIDFHAMVEFAKRGIEPDEEVMSQVKCVFVDGLPAYWDEEEVRDKFHKYGEIERVRLARNMAATKRKDFGFIHFSTREATLACIEGINENEVNTEDNKVTLKASLQKPPQKGQTYGVRAGYGGSNRVPWVRGVGDGRFGVCEGRRFLDERHQPFGRAYIDRRPPGSGRVRSDVRRCYREDEDYVERRATFSARSVGTVTNERCQPFGRAYDRRPPGSAHVARSRF